MIYQLSPGAGILFFCREIAQKLIRRNYFSQLVNELVVGPVKNLIFEDEHLLLIFLVQENKIITDLNRQRDGSLLGIFLQKSDSMNVNSIL